MTPERVGLGTPDLILVRYGELALKRGNRRQFEHALMRNIKAALAPITPATLERAVGRIYVRPARRVAQAARRITDVFGIKSVSPAWCAENDADALVEVSRQLLDEALKEHRNSTPVTFRVRVRRANKSFPMQSTELERYIADRILPGPERVKVQLKDPELTLGIEVRDDLSYLFLSRLAGHGGLPVGTLGRSLCLLSGGIDSPVAAWMTMKRGCEVGYLSFHSAPFIGEGFKKKVSDLVRALARWQSSSTLFIVPFAEIQTTIRDTAPEAYRTVLYRRMMQRIGQQLSERSGFSALITGECLGQVASQTLENLTCIGAATAMPVLRPLLGFDKEEIIEIARKIGTYEISTIHEPDCCTVFQPTRPVIRGRLQKCLEAESRMDVDALLERAVAGVEVRTLDYEGGA